MEELIRSVDILYNQHNHDIDEIQQAKEFTNQFVENNFKYWEDFFNYIFNETNPELVRFWFISSLTEIIQKKIKELSKLD